MKRMMYSKFIKRLLDFFLSLLAIVILFPFMLIIGIIIKLTMGGPAIFKQERLGWHEKNFMIYKFRSMNEKKDEDGKLLPDVQRISKFGRVMRALSIDELPELFNIVKGDMSIIGPRPLLVKYLPLYNERQRHRHDVRPGLTGLAQVNGRNIQTWDQRLELDVEYANNITFKNDIRIFFETIRIVLKREGITTAETTAYTMTEFSGKTGD